MTTLADLITNWLGADLPVRFEAYDGSAVGPPDAPATIVVRSPKALRRIVTAPGELGMARAYVAGDLDLEGDIFSAITLNTRLPDLKLGPSQLLAMARFIGPAGLLPLRPPAEEVRLRGRRHTKQRDAAAVTHHYDVGNDFYRLVLGPSLTYSCALFTDPAESLETAQDNKHELVSSKLDLREGMRLLDVGCGWGGMVLHAATQHGADAVGVTLAREQANLASKRVAEAGLADQIAIRVQDYRDIDDGPYDAISSIGMFEHVGEARLTEYFTRLHRLLRPGGRLLNHGIGRPATKSSGISRGGFVDRYVFPDGELLEVGRVVSVMQECGFEVRHVESLREHYSLTLRRWTANLEAHWDEAVRLVGGPRARTWRLYMAASAVSFDEGSNQIYQVLAVKADGHRSGMPLRPRWGS